VLGSMLCTTCKNSYTLYPSNLSCMKCGDGYLQGNETCDDGGLGGCTSNCNGPNYGFDCVGGNV